MCICISMRRWCMYVCMCACLVAEFGGLVRKLLIAQLVHFSLLLCQGFFQPPEMILLRDTYIHRVLLLYMYVCMYVCFCIGTYYVQYVCMHVYMIIFMYVCMYVLYIWCIRMFVCMYVYMCICIYVRIG